MHDQSVPDVLGLSDDEYVVIETFYRAFTGANPDLLDHVVTPDWQDIPLAPGQAPGREGMKPLILGFAKAFPDVIVTIHQVIGVSGRIAVRAEIAGTHEGEWLGVAPTGRRFVMPIHEFHLMEKGRLTHTWHLEDWFGWLNQVGARSA